MQRNCRFTRFDFLLCVHVCCVYYHVSNNNNILQYNELTAFSLTRGTLIVKMLYVYDD